jgi:hypothetical protein
VGEAGWSVTASARNPGVTQPLRGGGVFLAEAVDAHAECPADGLAVDLVVTAVDEQLVAQRVTVSRLDGGEVTSRLLRQVPVLHLVRLAVQPEAVRESRQPTTDERVQQVVETWQRYHAVPATQSRATIETARALGLSRGYVSRLLTTARQSGRLNRT